MSQIIGAAELVAMRTAGQKPLITFLSVGHGPSRMHRNFPWYLYGDLPELFVVKPSPETDVRPLVGLDVVLFIDDLSAENYAFFERLQDFAGRITLSVKALPDDVIIWEKERGQYMLGERVNG